MTQLETWFGLQGKTALITGASSGLGAAFAHGLADAGANVVPVARRRERLDAMRSEIEARGGTCHPAVADITDSAQREAAVREAIGAFGSIDILVNNAGIADLAPPEKLTPEAWDGVLALNLTALFRLTQLVGRAMIERGQGGRIVNLSSAVGQAANTIFSTTAYAASKAGVEGLTRQLAHDWAPHGITVNAIAPGWFPTEMNIDPRFGDIHPKYKEKMLARIPMNRLGDPAELAATVVFLASPAAAYITGVVIPVDGGWMAG